MVIINGNSLLQRQPFQPMISSKEKAHGVSYGLAETGYDVRIKQKVVFTPPNLFQALEYYSNVNLDDPTNRQEFEKFANGFIEVTDGDEVTLYIGRFCKASTLEEWNVPEDVSAAIYDKSTWARVGLSIFNTIAEPGWKGYLTAELAFTGMEPVTIEAGSGFGQVIFTQVIEPKQYEGKYQGQANEVVHAKFE